jgi:hypothetical protein
MEKPRHLLRRGFFAQKYRRGQLAAAVCQFNHRLTAHWRIKGDYDRRDWKHELQ